MKLQKIIDETIVDFYKKIEADVQNDTGESILPVTANDVEGLIESEIGHLIKHLSQKDYYTDEPLVESDLVPLYIIEEVLWQVFDKLDYEALANKVNQNLCKA